jgi:hypothetical protein
MHRHYPRSVYVLAGVLSVPITLAFLYALWVYLAYFRMGSVGGPVMFLAYVGLPGSLVLAVTLALMTVGRARRAGVAPSAALRRSVAIVGIVFVLLLLAEFWRTAEHRTPEAGRTMTGYVRALLRR